MNQGVMMFKRSVWYIIGLNCIALSVVLNIRFDLGVAAFSSVMYAISEIYHISLGMASIICYLIFVVLQCLMSKKVTLVFILEVPLSIVFGLLTDVYDLIIPEPAFGLADFEYCGCDKHHSQHRNYTAIYQLRRNFCAVSAGRNGAGFIREPSPKTSFCIR